MVGSEYFIIPTSPLPSPPMSALSIGTDKSQQHQHIPSETTNFSDASIVLTDPESTWLNCNLQQKDILNAPWSSHYNHHPRGESHPEQLLTTADSPSSPILRVDEWDQNLAGQSKFYSFDTPEISYRKCISTDSGSSSSQSPAKTKCPADETDWDGLEASIDLTKEIEAEETTTMTPAEIHQQKRKMKRFRYVPFLDKGFAAAMPILSNIIQTYTPANAISHERICPPVSSRCSRQRAFSTRDTRVESQTSTSLVPE